MGKRFFRAPKTQSETAYPTREAWRTGLAIGAGALVAVGAAIGCGYETEGIAALPDDAGVDAGLPDAGPVVSFDGGGVAPPPDGGE